ncbi:MAG: SUMF1/EgtB/PvdO family nonheme iron enzyme, partial [Opitutales bacterium]|nr:SUMF1/EgtB/PvdO family nonheme iron enzyme [Opitutales bacterium]
MKSTGRFALLFGILSQSLFSANPVPYSGKIDIGGVNYYGEVQFAFSLHDENGATHWRNGNQPGETIKVTIRNGRYNVLLGGQGMNSLPPELFLNHDKLYLKVEFDDGDGKGLRHLAPDQLITATPRALVAEVAKVAKVAEKVGNGAITRDMLSAEVRADLNSSGSSTPMTPQSGSIARDMLASDVLADLNRTVTKQMLGQDILTDMNRTITASHLAQNTITTAQLNEQILKYLKPEITVSPQAPGLIFGGQSLNLISQAQGKYLTYQWQRNGQPIAGATGPSFSISDVNGSLHDGNYTVVVSNDFGSVTSAITPLQVDGTPSSHTVASISMEMIFCPPGTFTMGSPTSETGRGTDETQHQVTLTNGFYLGKYEVTQAQYQTVMNGNSEGLNADPSQFKGSNRPVEKASW